MPISAHTNQVGFFVNHGVSKTVREGYRNGSSFIETTTEIDPIGFSLKSPVIKGLYPMSTRYYREVGKIINEVPEISSFWLDSSYHVKTTKSLRGRWPLAHMFPPDGHLSTVQEAGFRSHANALTSLKENRLQLGATAAELGKTVDMIARNTAQVLKSLRDFKRSLRSIGRVIVNPSQLSKVAANRYLELIYGWRPLLNDIYTGTRLLQSNNKLQNGLLFSVGSSSLSYYGSSFSSETRAVTKFKYRVSDATLFVVDQIGLGNPLSIAWEIVPFSFIADWFLPIGDLLESLTASQGLTLVDGYTSISSLLSYNLKGPEPSYQIGQQGVIDYKVFRFDRYHLSGFQLPGFVVYGQPFSSQRTLAALALIRQR